VIPHDPIEKLPPDKTALAMVFKLIEAAQKSWRCLNGHNQLPKLFAGVR
jgi:putative transposase